MSDLEKYIIENREKFSPDEPSEGHFDRFSKKLKQQSKPVRRLRFRHAIQIAASVAIILSSGVVIIKSSKGKNKMAVHEVPEQFMETNSYYVSQVNARYEQIEAISFTEEEEKEMLLKELSEMDEYYQQLLLDLNANPGDERVVSALIKHYRLKMQVMDQIIEQLNQFNQSKSESDEKSSV